MMTTSPNVISISRTFPVSISHFHAFGNHYTRNVLQLLHLVIVKPTSPIDQTSVFPSPGGVPYFLVVSNMFSARACYSSDSKSSPCATHTELAEYPTHAYRSIWQPQVAEGYSSVASQKWRPTRWLCALHGRQCN